MVINPFIKAMLTDQLATMGLRLIAAKFIIKGILAEVLISIKIEIFGVS